MSKHTHKEHEEIKNFQYAPCSQYTMSKHTPMEHE